MLKVLVVDDEPKVRRGVSRLIELYPEKYELVGSCKDAKETIKTLEKSVPDVIITDIRMPDKDGLEMINYLKHRYHNLDFIILSGYGDFEYAKKALQYRVFDFLLKPLEEEELFGALDAVLKKRKEKHIYRSESVEENYFFNLIKVSDKELEKMNLSGLGLLNKHGTYWVCIFDIWELDDDKLKEFGDLKHVVMQVVSEASYLYTCFDNQVIAIWEVEPTKDRLIEVEKILQKRLGCPVYIGSSDKGEDYGRLKELYFQALAALKQYIYNQEEKVHRYRDLEGIETLNFTTGMFEKVINGIRTGDTNKVSKEFKLLLDHYYKHRCGILKLKKHMLLFQKEIEGLIEEYGLDRKYSSETDNYIRNIEETRDFQELKRNLMTPLIDLTEEIEAVVQQKMQSFYLNKVLSYVQENYTRDLSLGEVAEYVNLSEGYLCNHFKIEMGKNFIDYITELRIEKAKDMLMNTNAKVYEIAKEVGYQNSQYFVTIFRKRLGITPTEYRKYL